MTRWRATWTPPTWRPNSSSPSRHDLDPENSHILADRPEPACLWECTHSIHHHRAVCQWLQASPVLVSVNTGWPDGERTAQLRQLLCGVASCAIGLVEIAVAHRSQRRTSLLPPSTLSVAVSCELPKQTSRALQVDIDLDLLRLESERRAADREHTASCRERDVVLHALKAALAAHAAAQVRIP